MATKLNKILGPSAASSGQTKPTFREPTPSTSCDVKSLVIGSDDGRSGFECYFDLHYFLNTFRPVLTAILSVTTKKE
jgi:hypothetical protein